MLTGGVLSCASISSGAHGFGCPEGDHAGCEVYDSAEKRWRHLDFFQHEAYLVARVPRVVCPEHGVRQVALPWARAGSGFTLLFEALVMARWHRCPSPRWQG